MQLPEIVSGRGKGRSWSMNNVSFPPLCPYCLSPNLHLCCLHYVCRKKVGNSSEGSSKGPQSHETLGQVVWPSFYLLRIVSFSPGALYWWSSWNYAQSFTLHWRHLLDGKRLDFMFSPNPVHGIQRLPKKGGYVRDSSLLPRGLRERWKIDKKPSGKERFSFKWEILPLRHCLGLITLLICSQRV